MVIFTKKKRLRQDTYQQQGLSNPGVVIFTKKSACGKIHSSNRACQILGGHFHRKKSACGKTSQQHRACQILGGHFHQKKSACGKTSQQQQGLSGPGQSPVRPKNIKFGPNWVQNQRFGLKICPNGSYGLSGPIRTTPRTQDGVPDPNLPHRHGGPGRLMSHPHMSASIEGHCCPVSSVSAASFLQNP